MLTYSHGCDFGVAVIERIENEHHNPNVALEVGYMLALDKPICFLRDKTLKAMPTDLVDLLSTPFDVDDMKRMRRALQQWVKGQPFCQRVDRRTDA